MGLKTQQKSKPMYKPFCSWKYGCTFLLERYYQPTQLLIRAELVSDKLHLLMRFCELEKILLRDINIELQQQSKHCDLFVKQSDIRNLRRNKQINFHEF